VLREIKPLWSLSEKEVLKHLSTRPSGLSSVEAQERLRQHGPNKVLGKEQRSVLSVLIFQFQNWLIITLLLATAISYLLGERLDAAVIFSLVILSVFLGFFQEYRAEKALAKLKKYITHKAHALRDGRWIRLNSQDLVGGDIVSLQLGNRVPADIRLLSCNGLMIDEAVLTGESFPVLKKSGSVSKEYTQPQKLSNMAFMGTFVSAGIGQGVVTAIGDQTFLGKTVKILEEKAPPSDFQKETRKFSAFLFRVTLIMALFVFSSNAILGKGILTSLLFALALAVGITPELLPVITTVTLSQGALRMAKRKVVVKRLISIEDLGNIDTLCTDKTGVLTEGIFSLVDSLDLDGKSNQEILLDALLCSSWFEDRVRGAASSPIDIAIWESRKATKLKEKVRECHFVARNEFDSVRKRNSVVVRSKEDTWMIVKGATESVLDASTQVMRKGRRVRIDNFTRESILHEVRKMEESGYRVMALAKRKLQPAESTPQEENLIFEGYLLFSDPVKKTAMESLQFLERLGVGIKVISGDSPTVVKKVAKETGLLASGSEVITGDILAKLKRGEFEEVVKRYNLFGRVTPDQKHQIVVSLTKEGHIVGFLGDGVNDAPALKAADVGIAVDTGTEIAKEAADIVLLKKDLTVLAKGIETGRKTFGNITKYILNTISANYGNMFTVMLSSLFLRFIPLLPSQILLNNFISDIPLLTIVTDNVDRGFIRKPGRWDIQMIARFMVYFGLLSSFFDLSLILPLLVLWKLDPSVFRTAWFVESALSEMIVTFAIRTRLPFYRSAPSRWLLAASVFSSLAVVGLPFLKIGHSLFAFTLLPPLVWVWIVCVLTSYFGAIEFVKKRFFAESEVQVRGSSPRSPTIISN